MRYLLFLCLKLAFLSSFHSAIAQNATDIVRKSDEKLNGASSFAEMTLTIVRPDWTREISMKSWAKGRDLSLILITAPARDKGTAFLKRSREIWNWQPGIDRTIKLPPSMMSQSWMGSDFTNDDLVRQSSIVVDYTHTIVNEEPFDGRLCWQIELLPKPDAPVVWSKVHLWIDKQDYIQVQARFFDDDGDLVHTFLGKDIGMIGGRMLARTLEVLPADKPGHLTKIVYKKLEFDISLSDSFFSLQQLKNAR
jgi:outer membrane lipoprotein-sorting protein